MNPVPTCVQAARKEAQRKAEEASRAEAQRKEQQAAAAAAAASAARKQEEDAAAAAKEGSADSSGPSGATAGAAASSGAASPAPQTGSQHAQQQRQQQQAQALSPVARPGYAPSPAAAAHVPAWAAPVEPKPAVAHIFHGAREVDFFTKARSPLGLLCNNRGVLEIMQVPSRLKVGRAIFWFQSCCYLGSDGGAMRSHMMHHSVDHWV